MRSWLSLLVLSLAVLAAPRPALCYPGQWHELGTAQTWVGAPTTPADVQRAILTDLSNTLRRYYPSGKGISDYKVEGHGYWSRLSFTVTREIAPLVTKTVNIVGVTSTPGRSNWCPNNALGSYYLELNLGGSSPLILENAWNFGLDICVELQDGGPNFFIRSKVWLREGGESGGKAAKATTELLRAQAWPLIEALSLRAQSYASGRD